MSVDFTRNGAHDLGGTVGLGPVPIEAKEPVFHAAWQGRTHGATIAAIITGILVPPTHRAVIEARVAVTLATPDAPMPRDRNAEILAGVMGFVTEGVPHGPEHLA